MTNNKPDEQRTKAVRLTAISLVLLAGEPLTVSDVQRRWKVSRKTAQRDLAQVETIIPIAIETRGKAWWVTSLSPVLSGLKVLP